MKSNSFTLTEIDILTIRFLGLFGCASQKQLKKITKITKRRLDQLIIEDYIWKPSYSNSKTCIVDKKGNKTLVYILKKKGLEILRKYHPDVVFTRSKSLYHDYNNVDTILMYANPKELLTYESERYIRASYRDIIKYISNKNNITISCPDGCFYIGDIQYFVETLNCYNTPMLESKKNFALCLDNSNQVLVIVRFGKEIYRSPLNKNEGGDSNEEYI